MTTAGEILNWFKEGQKKKATHMIVVCDTFDHEDYPVYVTRKQDPKVVYAEYSGKNMQRVMEVYALHKPFREQAGIVDGVGRAFDYSKPTDPVVTPARPPPSLYTQLLASYLHQTELQIEEKDNLPARTKKEVKHKIEQNVVEMVKVIVQHGVTPEMAKQLGLKKVATVLQRWGREKTKRERAEAANTLKSI